MSTSRYISVSDLAQELGCSTMTVLRLITRGVLTAHRLDGCKFWIDKHEAAEYIAAKRIEAMKRAKAARDIHQLKLDFFED